MPARWRKVSFLQGTDTSRPPTWREPPPSSPPRIVIAQLICGRGMPSPLQGTVGPGGIVLRGVAGTRNPPTRNPSAAGELRTPASGGPTRNPPTSPLRGDPPALQYPRYEQERHAGNSGRGHLRNHLVHHHARPAAIDVHRHHLRHRLVRRQPIVAGSAAAQAHGASLAPSSVGASPDLRGAASTEASKRSPKESPDFRGNNRMRFFPPRVGWG